MRIDALNQREVFGLTLVELGQKYKNLVVLDADLNTSTRTVLFKEAFPDRFIQCGIAESNMMGMAAGLAKEGFIPMPSTFASFAAHKALDQVYMNVCLPKLNVKIPGSYVGVTAGECGASHNCADDLAIMRSMPFTKVAAPGDNAELAACMRAMMETDGPVYFRVPRIEGATLFSDGHEFVWGKGHVLEEGSDAALLGTGFMTGILLRAAELLKKDGIHCTVAHFGSIKPLDEELVKIIAKSVPLMVTLENGRIFGGFGGAVAETVAECGGAKVLRMGLGDDVFHSDMIERILRHCKLTPEDVAQKVKENLQR